jgi:preprotein translocase subunit SecE
VAQKEEKQKKPNIIQKIGRFWRETIGELRKVTWPTTKEAWELTKVVLLVTVVMSLVLGIMDYGFSKLIGLLITS